MASIKIVDDPLGSPHLLRCTPKAIQTTTTHTEILRITFDEQYISKKLQTTARERPRKALGDWASTLPAHIANSIHDTWGWKQEHTGPNRAITGLIRVQGTFGSKDAPDYILGRSGQQGIFTAPIHWHNPLPNIKVEWEKWQTTDTHEDYIQRLLERGHQWGLARGPRGLGARIEAEASTQHTRTWQLDRTPREWTQHTVQDLLQANPAFEHTHIIKKQVRGPTATWWFQATTQKELDLHPIFATLDNNNLELWARLAPPTRRTGSTKAWPIKDPSVLQWTHDRTSLSIGTGATKMEEAQPQNGNRSPSGQPQKRQCIPIRDIPKGFLKEEVPGDGACLFHCLGKAFSTPTNEILAIQARAEVVAHLNKHQETYAPLWDGLQPDNSKGTTFTAYLEEMQKPTTWGGWLELTAAARHWNTRIIIVPETLADDIMVFHDSRRAEHTTIRRASHNGGSEEEPTLHTHAGQASHHHHAGHTVFTSDSSRGTPAATTTSQPPTAANHGPQHPQQQPSHPRRRQPPPQRQHMARGWRAQLRHPHTQHTRGPHHSRFGDHNRLVWKCPLCPYETAHAITEQTSKAHRASLLRAIWSRKSNHIAHCHPDQRQQLTHANGSDNKQPVIARLAKKQPGWHCNKCTAGIPQAQLSQLSYKRLRQAQWEHARDKHGVPDRATWAKQQHSHSNKTLANRNKHVTRRRAAGLAATLVQVNTNPGGHQLHSFFFPFWSHTRNTHTTCRAWVCQRCGQQALNKRKALHTLTNKRCAGHMPANGVQRRRKVIQRLSKLARAPPRDSRHPATTLRHLYSMAAATLEDNLQHLQHRQSTPMTAPQQKHTIKLGTLNVQHLGHTWEEVIHLAHTHHIDCLAIQEATLHNTSICGYTKAAQAHGYTLHCSNINDNHAATAILTRIPCTKWEPPHTLPFEVPDPNRTQFIQLHRHGQRPLFLANIYAHQSNHQQRDQLIHNTTQLLRHIDEDFIVMGDFNTTCDEGATANLVANGIAHDANGFFNDWQPTRHPGQRCIDYALVSPRVHPQTKQQHPGPRDHDLITYTFPVGPSPPGHRRPQLRGINHEHTITPQQFQDRWNQQQFQQHLDNHDTTAAWTMLSDVAEDLLSADNSHGLRRSTLWQPIQHTQPAKHTLSKQTFKQRRLLRTLRTARELQRHPRSDTQAALQRRLLSLQHLYPNLTYNTLDELIHTLEAHIHEEAEQHTSSRIQRWMTDMHDNPSKQRHWVRQPAAPAITPPATSHTQHAIHPQQHLQEQTSIWMNIWNRPHPGDPAGTLHTPWLQAKQQHTQLLQSWLPPTTHTSPTLHITTKQLLQAARRSRGKAAGGDGWQSEHFPGPPPCLVGLF